MERWLIEAVEARLSPQPTPPHLHTKRIFFYTFLTLHPHGALGMLADINQGSIFFANDLVYYSGGSGFFLVGAKVTLFERSLHPPDFNRAARKHQWT